MSKTAARVLFGILLAMALASCGDAPATASPTAQPPAPTAVVIAASPPTPAPAATSTPSPTATAAPTPTPTATPFYTPTPAAMHIPTQSPTATPTPAPTHTPAPTPSPAPTLTPIATPAQGYQVVTRDLEYAYSIDVPEGWTPEYGEYRHRENNQGGLAVIVVDLAEGTGLERFAQSVRDGLRGDYPIAPLFEMTSFERTQVGGRDAYSIAYRVRKSPGDCISDVTETVVAASSIPGYSQGFRARYSLCGWRAIFGFREVRTRILDSFRVEAAPPAYYTQFVFVHGVTVKASAKVAPEALVKAAESVAKMILGLRNDMRACLVRDGAAMAIFPEGESVVALPEFAHIKGEEILHFDILADDFQGGLGAIKGEPVSAIPEWNLSGDADDPYVGVGAMHEFAHAVMNLCFTRGDHAELGRLYREALQADAFPDTYAMTNEDEFFAETSLAYFNAPIHDWRLAENQSFQDALRTTLPKTFAFLERVYGEPPAR